MYIPFDELNPNARVWVYQADRKLTDAEVDFIHKEGVNFVTSWTAHSKALKSSIEIFYNQFIVLSVDESAAAATGCSIDKSVHFVQALENQLGVQLLDKSRVAYVDGDAIKQVPFPAIKEKVNDGTLNKESIIFNNMVTDLGSFKSQWKIPAKDSWMSRYF
jgi:hypothetical protein